jgi:hypothetical protein
MVVMGFSILFRKPICAASLALTGGGLRIIHEGPTVFARVMDGLPKYELAKWPIFPDFAQGLVGQITEFYGEEEIGMRAKSPSRTSGIDQQERK